MRKRWILGVVGVLALVLAGCGGGDTVPAPYIFEQLSDQTVDADISYDGVNDPVIFPATKSLSVRIGVDGSGIEYRGFLDFPLVPKLYGANVQFAYVEVFVNSVPFRADVPVLMELVDFPPHFYKQVLACGPKRVDGGYSVFDTGACALVMGRTAKCRGRTGIRK